MTYRKNVHKIFVLVCIFLLNAGLLTELKAQISFVTVEKIGSGIKEQDAVMDAIEQALMQVNGAAVATSSMTTISESMNSKGGQENYESAEEFLQKISTSTKGIIKGYEILQSDKGKGDLALYEVKISVNVTKYETSKQLKRLRIAVPRIYLTRGVNNKKTQEAAYEIKGKIIDQLTQTRKFAMIDREFLGDTDKELKLIQGKNFKIEEMARLGNQVGVDFILLPTVFKHKISKSVRNSKFSDKKYTTYLSLSEVSIKLIDVATSQIKLSKTLKVSGNSSNYSLLADKIALRISETITNSIMPPQIISLTGKELIINQGGDAMAKGRRFNIFRLGKRLYDPDTNESLGREETLSGVVQIVRSTSKTSAAKLIKKIKIKSYSEFINDLFVLRPDMTQKNAGRVKRKSVDAADKEINKRMDKLKKKSKDDW